MGTDAAGSELCDESGMRGLLVFSLFVVGCINTDPAVFVESSIASPSIAVQSSALATGINGSFVLSLHLGARASGPSTTSLAAASLVDEDGEATLASTLGFTAMPPLPTSVPVNETLAITVSLAAIDNQLPADQRAAICGTTLRIRALVEDSLRGVPMATDSAPFTASGCN